MKWVIIGGGIPILLSVALVVFFRYTQRRLQEERSRLHQAKLEYQEELLSSAITTQEKDRKRIAEDLHDNIGSKLNVMHLQLHQLKKRLPTTTERVSILLGVLKDTINTSRRISHHLMPPTLENFGLGYAIEELVDEYEEGEDIEIQLDIRGEMPLQRNNITELHVYRILQELLSIGMNNTECSKIQIGFWQNENKLILSYQDNGNGIYRSADKQRLGMGMKNIESRLQVIQGTYDLNSTAETGMRLQLEAYFQAEQTDNPPIS